MAAVQAVSASEAGCGEQDAVSLIDYRRLPSAALVDVVAEGDELASVALLSSALIVGTQLGRVWALRRGSSTPVEVGKHDGCVVAVAVDGSGAFVASAATDGSLAVGPMRSSLAGETEHAGPPRWVCMYSRPILSIAFSPLYTSGDIASRAICVGGEECKLMINRRGAFESRHITVHSGEGPISRIAWRGTLIAWANTRGVKIVDVETYQKVTHLAPPSSTHSGAARCCITWHADDVLFIGWGCVVMIAEVRQKAGGPAGVRFARVANCFSLETGIVCGVVAFDSSRLAILTAQSGGKETSEQSLLHHICSRDGHVLSCERLAVQGNAERAGHLVAAAGEQVAYATTSREIIAIERRTIASHVSWLIGDGQFEAAIALESRSGGLARTGRRNEICILCIGPLIAHGEAERAARIIRQLGVADAGTWHECIRIFGQAGKLELLVPIIPCEPERARLPCEAYDEVLNSLAVDSPRGLLAALDRWPSGVYTPAPLIALLHTMLPAGVADDGSVRKSQADEHRLIVQALASLHEVQGDYAGAAALLLRVGSDALFPFLARHLGEDEALCKSALADLKKLFDFRPWEALALFVSHVAAFPPGLVVEALADFGRWWQHQYLKLLLQRNSRAAREFAILQCGLFADFEPQNLRPRVAQLLRHRAVVTADTSPDESSAGGSAEAAVRESHESESTDQAEEEENNGMDLDSATCNNLLELARSRAVVDAEALILARRGCERDSLRLLLHQLGDVSGAFQLASAAAGDLAAGLWEDLVGAVSNDARAFALLLACLSTSREPPSIKGATQAGLVKQLPNDLELRRLPAHVARALQDAEADLDVHGRTLDVLKKATSTMSSKLFTTQRRGVAVTPSKSSCSSNSANFIKPEAEAPALPRIRAPHFQLSLVLRAAMQSL